MLPNPPAKGRNRRQSRASPGRRNPANPKKPIATPGARIISRPDDIRKDEVKAAKEALETNIKPPRSHAAKGEKPVPQKLWPRKSAKGMRPGARAEEELARATAEQKETLPRKGPESRKKPKSRRALPQKRCPPPLKTRSRPCPGKECQSPFRAPRCLGHARKAPPPHPTCRQGAMKPKSKNRRSRKEKTNYPGCALFRVPRRPRPGLRGQPQAHPARGQGKKRRAPGQQTRRWRIPGPRRRARLLLQRPCPRMALPCSHLWKDATARAKKKKRLSGADAR